jgi:hypothetical protein
MKLGVRVTDATMEEDLGYYSVKSAEETRGAYEVKVFTSRGEHARRSKHVFTSRRSQWSREGVTLRGGFEGPCMAPEGRYTTT